MPIRLKSSKLSDGPGGEAEGVYLSHPPGLFPAPSPEQERGQGPTSRFQWVESLSQACSHHLSRISEYFYRPISPSSGLCWGHFPTLGVLVSEDPRPPLPSTTDQEGLSAPVSSLPCGVSAPLVLHTLCVFTPHPAGRCSYAVA